MNITIIAAVAGNRVIGNTDGLPWSCKEDLKWFKENTLGKAVILGRKTYETLSGPLSERTNIVITRDEQYKADPGVLILPSVDTAISLCKLNPDETFIIGGASVYEQAMSSVDRLLITHIEQDFDGNAFFPHIDPNVWEKKLIRQGEESNEDFTYGFYEYRLK